MTAKSKIRNEAAEWVLRLDESSETNFPVEDWRQWMDRSPQHEEIFKGMLELWGITSLLPKLSEENEINTNTAELLHPDNATIIPVGHPIIFKVRRMASASYASVAASVAILFLVSIAALLPNYIADTAEDQNKFSTNYKTGKNEHRSLVMSDGSKIELGADSSIRVDYGTSNRTIFLGQGVGYFEVAKDEARPFIVYSNNSYAKALGTAFNVHRSLGKTTVSVAHGVVELAVTKDTSNTTIKDPKEYSRLTIGETAFVSSKGVISPTHKSDSEYETAWRNGRLVFENAELRSIIEDLNRYSDTLIVVDEIDTASLKFSGTVASDSVAKWLQALPLILDVQIRNSGDRIHISKL